MSTAKQKTLKLILRLAAVRRWPSVAGRVMVWSCSPARTNRPRILLVNSNKDGIVADATESLGAEFEILQWPAYVVKICADAILSDRTGGANDYVSDDVEVEQSKSELREFFADSWRYFHEYVPVAAAISSNFGFRSEREFAGALESCGTPFIVLHKENMNGVTPERWSFWHSAYQKRGRFAGRKILTNNDIERKLQISSGVVEPERVMVVGMPRLDRMHRWRKEHAGELCGNGNTVLFFSFDRRNKIPPGSRFAHLNWNNICVDTHRALFQLAADHPSINLIVKMKGQSAQYQDILEVIGGLGDATSNVQVVVGGDPVDLIASARVVVGFNTTANRESLAAGKPVIVPHYAEALDSALQPFILDMGRAIEYANSPIDLTAKVRHYIECPATIPRTLSPEVAKALRQWTGNDDGRASLRVREAILSELRPQWGEDEVPGNA